jgi:hypothetical protein
MLMLYVVLDDFGKLGRAYREVDEEAAYKESVIRNLMDGQNNDRVRIVAFNTAKGWARDVTEEVSIEIHNRIESSSAEPHGTRTFRAFETNIAPRALYSRTVQMEFPITDPDLRRRIEQRAFEIWKSEGFPSGRDWAHWVQAETEILGELEAGPTDEGKGPGETPELAS